MDAVRGIAVALVVFHHAINIPRVIYGIEIVNPTWDALIAFVSPFRMPLLLAISGLLLTPAVHKPLLRYTDGKVRKILWPYLLWTAITIAVIQGWNGISTIFQPFTWIAGTYHMWFLVVLLECYVLGVLVRYIPAWTLPLALLCALVVLDPSTGFIRRFLYYGFFFFLGAAIKTILPRWMEAPRWTFALMGALTLGISGAAFADLLTIDIAQPLTTLLAIPGILSVLWLAHRAPRLTAFEFIGRRSIVIYTVHFPVQAAVSTLASPLLPDHSGIFLALTLTSGLGIPLLIAAAYRWTKPAFEFPFPVIPSLSEANAQPRKSLDSH